MSNFLNIANDAIAHLRNSPEYEPGKEVSILIPLKSKTATLKGVNLDNAKISWIDEPRHALKDRDGNALLEPSNSGLFICRITGKVR